MQLQRYQFSKCVIVRKFCTPHVLTDVVQCEKMSNKLKIILSETSRRGPRIYRLSEDMTTFQYMKGDFPKKNEDDIKVLEFLYIGFAGFDSFMSYPGFWPHAFFTHPDLGWDQICALDFF